MKEFLHFYLFEHLPKNKINGISAGELIGWLWHDNNLKNYFGKIFHKHWPIILYVLIGTSFITLIRFPSLSYKYSISRFLFVLRFSPSVCVLFCFNARLVRLEKKQKVQIGKHSRHSNIQCSASLILHTLGRLGLGLHISLHYCQLLQ